MNEDSSLLNSQKNLSTLSIKDLNKEYLESKISKNIKYKYYNKQLPNGDQSTDDTHHKSTSEFSKSLEQNDKIKHLRNIQSKKQKENAFQPTAVIDKNAITKQKQKGSFFTTISQACTTQNSDKSKIRPKHRSNKSFVVQSHSTNSTFSTRIEKIGRFESNNNNLHTIQEVPNKYKTQALNSPTNVDKKEEAQNQLIQEYMKLKDQLHTLRRSQSREHSKKRHDDRFTDVNDKKLREKTKDREKEKEKEIEESRKRSKSNKNKQKPKRKHSDVIELQINLLDNKVQATRNDPKEKCKRKQSKQEFQQVDSAQAKGMKINLNLSSNVKTNNFNNSKIQQQVWPSSVNTFMSSFNSIVSPKTQAFNMPQMLQSLAYNQQLLYYQQQQAALAQLPRYSLNTVQSYENISFNGYMSQRSNQIDRQQPRLNYIQGIPRLDLEFAQLTSPQVQPPLSGPNNEIQNEYYKSTKQHCKKERSKERSKEREKNKKVKQSKSNQVSVKKNLENRLVSARQDNEQHLDIQFQFA